MKFFLLCISTISILTLYIVSFSFRFYVHPILNLITHGVSGGKIYFFLIYSAISFLVLLFYKEKTKFGISKENHWTKRLFFFFVFLGMASSIGSYLYYIHKYSLSIQTYHYHFKDIYNSVNFFPHIHTSKLYLHIIGRAFGMDHLLGGMDDGRVFEGAIPIFFPYITLCSILVTVPLSFFLMKKIVHSWGERYQAGISILCGISFSSVFKTISDGGPLAYDFLLAISLIYILTGTKSPEDVAAFIKKRWRIFFWCLFFVFSLMCLIDHSFGILIYTIKNSLIIFIVYSAIYFLTIRDTIKKRWLHVIIVLYSLFFSYAVYMQYIIYIKPFHNYLEKGTEIHYFHYKERPLPEFLEKGRAIFDSEFLKIYSFSTEERIQPIKIYKAFSENPYRNRHIAIISPKKRQAYGIIADILFIDFKRRETSLKVPGIIHLKLTKKDFEKEKFDAEIAFNPLYFPALSHAEEGRITQLDENHKFVMYYFLNRFFLYYGVKEYILTPIAFYRFN